MAALPVILLLLLVAPAWATTVSYQEGVGSAPYNAATPDTLMASALATTNFGTQNSIWVEGTGGNVSRGIVEFNISDIPSTATINSATFAYYVNSIDNNPSIASTCNRLIRTDWVEGEATWNIYKTSNNWTTAGAGSNGNDIDTSVAFAFTPSAGTGAKTVSVTAFVADAVANRSGMVRFVCKIDSETGASHYWYLDSGEGATSTRRPKLTIDYTAAGGAVPRRRLM